MKFMTEKNYPENLSINQWADDDKPREKLILKGKASLTDAELVAILLRSGSRNETVVELSKKLLHCLLLPLFLIDFELFLCFASILKYLFQRILQFADNQIF